MPEPAEEVIQLNAPANWEWGFVHPPDLPSMMVMRVKTGAAVLDFWFDVDAAKRFIGDFEEQRDKMVNIIIPQAPNPLQWRPPPMNGSN